MKLTRFKTEVFAGINNQELKFSDGLNIILGKNEAGKSTIINAIYATLFQNAKIRLNYSEDKEFRKNFFPYPNGDYIHALLEFEVNSNKYLIEKEWSRENPSQYLEFPNGHRVQSENKIKKRKKELLKFGKGTYNNIVFTKQKEIKSSIKKIVENDEVKNTVNNFLRRAVMELDGISIDKLNKKINNELDNLLAKWNIENNRPSNPDRDINNPYKRAYGLIYESYIKKETIRKKMRKTKEIEKDFEKISKELKEIKDKKKIITKKVNHLAEIEDDIFQRGQIEPEVKALKDRMKRIKKINKKWPVIESKLTEEKKKLNSLDEELSKLKKKRIKAKKQNKMKLIKEKLDKVQDKKEKIEELKREREKINNINKKDIEKLTELKEIISRTEVSLEASRLLAKINYSNSTEIKVHRGINEMEIIKADNKIEANAYLRIITDNIDIEVQSAEINFEEIQNEYTETKKEYNLLLKKLQVEDLKSANLKFQTLNEINNKISNLNDYIEEILEKEDYHKLQEKYNDFEEEEVEDLEKINNKIDKLKDEKISELKINIKNKEDKIKNWKEEYNSYDNLMDKMIDIKSEINTKEKQLANLAQVPQKFSSPTEFKNRLSELRRKKEKLEKDYNLKKEKILDIENKLPDNSYEEYLTIFEEEKRNFTNLITRAKKIIKIKNVINEKLEDMEGNSLLPLVKSFNKNLNILTAGKYNMSKINDDFQIRIEDNKKNYLPANIDLLSYGTYDGVALALRLAIFENLFKNKSSFIVLDDCLVNLDPERKKRAINLINDFQSKHQIIFSTCNPETADNLDGKIIKIN